MKIQRYNIFWFKKTVHSQSMNWNAIERMETAENFSFIIDHLGLSNQSHFRLLSPINFEHTHSPESDNKRIDPLVGDSRLLFILLIPFNRRIHHTIFYTLLLGRIAHNSQQFLKTLQFYRQFFAHKIPETIQFNDHSTHRE